MGKKERGGERKREREEQRKMEMEREREMGEERELSSNILLKGRSFREVGDSTLKECGATMRNTDTFRFW